MRHHYREFIIMSAEREKYSKDKNHRLTARLSHILLELGINCKPIDGYYKGSKEVSFMCFLEPNKGFDIEFFERLAKNFDQECILYRDKYNKCYLHWSNKKPDGSHVQKLDGSFKEVDRVDMYNDSFSVIKGKYYAVC